MINTGPVFVWMLKNLTEDRFDHSHLESKLNSGDKVKKVSEPLPLLFNLE